MMDNTVRLLDLGFQCLVEKLGVVDAEQFIYLIKSERFDYTVWQREYFDNMQPGVFTEQAFDYAKENPYTGKGEIL